LRVNCNGGKQPFDSQVILAVLLSQSARPAMDYYGKALMFILISTRRLKSGPKGDA